jgi:hypothetical protein
VKWNLQHQDNQDQQNCSNASARIVAPIPAIRPRRCGTQRQYKQDGIYHRTQEFTQPSSATVVGFDPFFGFYSVDVPVTQVLASYSVNKPGVDVGRGFGFGTKWHAKF